MPTILIKSLGEMGSLGKILAEGLAKFPVQAIFLNGALGCGKTTLTRSIVLALPGGNLAEVGSPSFTICNYYPCRPQIAHCDLYREPHIVPEEIYENFDNPGITCIIEWGAFMDEALRPEEVLEIEMEIKNNQRLLTVESSGHMACALLEYVLSHLPKIPICFR